MCPQGIASTTAHEKAPQSYLPLLEAAKANSVSFHDTKKPNSVQLHDTKKQHSVPLHDTKKQHSVQLHDTKKPHSVPLHDTKKPHGVSIHDTKKPHSVPLHEARKPHSPSINENAAKQHSGVPSHADPFKQHCVPVNNEHGKQHRVLMHNLGKQHSVPLHVQRTNAYQKKATSHSLELVGSRRREPATRKVKSYEDVADYDVLQITEFSRGPFYNTDYDVISELASPTSSKVRSGV